jgi:hypothetical protein
LRIHVARSTILPMAEASLDGAMCVPNITGPGRKRRRQFAIAMLVVGVGAFSLLTYLHFGPLVRALSALPFAAAAASYLQVTRNTCVAHARAGTIEHDDFSTTPAPADQSAASQRVANTILRDAGIVAVVVGLLAAASAYVI